MIAIDDSHVEKTRRFSHSLESIEDRPTMLLTFQCVSFNPRRAPISLHFAHIKLPRSLSHVRAIESYRAFPDFYIARLFLIAMSIKIYVILVALSIYSCQSVLKKNVFKNLRLSNDRISIVEIYNVYRSIDTLLSENHKTRVVRLARSEHDFFETEVSFQPRHIHP